MFPYGAVRIIEDHNLVDSTEDWSRVRSPSRALRRMKMGHKQNVRIVSKPKMSAYSLDGGRTLIMHPAMAAALRAATR